MRTASLDRPIKKTLAFRESIVGQVDLALVDPLTKKPIYGGWSNLIEELLQQWLDGKVKTSLQPVKLSLEDLSNG